MLGNIGKTDFVLKNMESIPSNNIFKQPPRFHSYNAAFSSSIISCTILSCSICTMN